MSRIYVFFRRTKLIALAIIFTFLSVFSAAIAALPHPSQRPWALEAGVFTGIRYNAFQYQAFYNNPETTVSGQDYSQNFANDTFKSGYILGGELGIIRTFRGLFDFGFVVSGVGSSAKSLLTNHVDSDDLSAEDGWVDIINRFSIKYQFDLALMLGVNLTPKAFMYAKIGPSYTRVDQSENLTSYSDETGSYSYTSFKNSKKKWGGVFGLGIKYFFTKRIGVFAEYDYYDYGRITLPTIDPVNLDLVAAGNNTLTQSIKPKFGALHFGINVNIF